MTEPRPVALPDAVTAPWWDATREGRLLIQRCPSCGHHQHYPRNICTACAHLGPEFVESVGHGTIYSHTTVHRAPHPAFTPPYVVALVRLAEGPVLLANVVGCEPGAVQCDMPVRLVWEDLDDGRRLPMFTPEA
jgi:uncharacterized OB-fold protein